MNNFNAFFKKLGEWIGYISSILAILGFFGIDIGKLKECANTLRKCINNKYEKIKRLLFKQYRNIIEIIFLISVKFKEYIYTFRKYIAYKNGVIKRKIFKQNQNMIKIINNNLRPLKTICYGLLFGIMVAYPIITSDSEILSVVACEKENPIQVSKEGIDVLVTAATSFPAERVTISATSGTEEYGAFDMYKTTNGWWFNANFYEKGTFTVLITAYTSDGQTATDSFEYTY